MATNNGDNSMDFNIDIVALNNNNGKVVGKNSIGMMSPNAPIKYAQKFAEGLGATTVYKIVVVEVN